MSALTLNFLGSIRAAPSSGPSAREERAASGQSGEDFGALLDQGRTEAPLAAAGASDGVAREGADKDGAARTDSNRPASGLGAPLSDGEADLVANLLCLAAPAGSAGGATPAAASGPLASKGDGAARLPDWAALNMAASDASDAERPPRSAAETSAAATERRTIADSGAAPAEANRVASALSIPILKGMDSARAAAADPAVEGPPSGRDDEAKTTRPETGGKDEPQPASQAAAPAVPTPLDAGMQGVTAASCSVAATTVPWAATPVARGDSPPRDRNSQTAPGAAVTTQAPAPSRARDSADLALSLSTSREDATTRVSVTSQRTWLEPVRPDFVPATQGAEARGGAEAPAGAETAQPVSQPVEAPAPADTTALIPQSRAENFAVPASGAAQPVDKPAAVADPAPRAATPRRDLEVTLEPRDLGGLALRLKSVGDRLEIAFVADKGATAQMIGDGSGTLASQLRVAGLGLGGVAISVETKLDVAANPGADHAGQASAARGDDASAGAWDQGGGQGSREQDVAPRRQQSFSVGGQEQRDESTGNGDNARTRRGDRGFYL